MEVDEDEQTEVIRVPKHGAVNKLELLNDFKAVIISQLHPMNIR